MMSIKNTAIAGKYFIYGTLVLLCHFFIACHKEDPDGFDMETNDFISQVSQEQHYQLALLDSLQTNSADVQVRDFVKGREQVLTAYLLELASYVSSKSIAAIPLSKEHREKLSLPPGLSGGEYRKALINLLMDSDQHMIATHVKASSNQGLISGELRAWAREKLPQLTKNLDALQRINN